MESHQLAKLERLERLLIEAEHVYRGAADERFARVPHLADLGSALARARSRCKLAVVTAGRPDPET